MKRRTIPVIDDENLIEFLHKNNYKNYFYAYKKDNYDCVIQKKKNKNRIYYKLICVYFISRSFKNGK